MQNEKENINMIMLKREANISSPGYAAANKTASEGLQMCLKTMFTFQKCVLEG